MTNFYKYQGTGNDFIIVDGFKNADSFLDRSVKNINFLCDRRFGIGADGLIIIKESNEADFEMQYYNADGNPGSMCGNGSRCAVAFAYFLGYVEKSCKFIAYDGLHFAEILNFDVDDFEVKVTLQGCPLPEPFKGDYVLNTGSPHYMKLVENLNVLDVKKSGAEIRYNSEFNAQGINVNFICPDNKKLNVRTYERGVEDETLSCGTGVTASAITASFLGLITTEGYVDVSTRGGPLKVWFEKTDSGYKNIWLEGPAVQVFKGEI